MKEPIRPENIRKDDLIRKEYHEPLETTVAYEYFAQHDGDAANLTPASFFVLERAKPALPTEPHTIIQYKHAGIWFLGDGGHCWWRVLSAGEVQGLGMRERDMPDEPFEVTSAPVSETAKRVLGAVRACLTMPLDGQRPNGEFMIRAESLDAIAAAFGESS